MAKYIDKTFESNSGGGMSDFAENMANAGQISTARRAYKYVLDKGEECVYYQRSLIGYANVMYESFIQTPDKGERLEELKKLFKLVFEKCGYGKESFETILSAAEVLAFYDSQAEQAVELLERCIKTNSFSINEKSGDETAFGRDIQPFRRQLAGKSFVFSGGKKIARTRLWQTERSFSKPC